MPDPVPEMITIDEMSRYLRCGHSWLYSQARRWKATGGKEGLPSVRLGAAIRFPRREVEQHLGVTIAAIPPAKTPAAKPAAWRRTPRPAARSATRKP